MRKQITLYEGKQCFWFGRDKENSMKRKSRDRCLTYSEPSVVEDGGSVVLKIISEKED